MKKLSCLFVTLAVALSQPLAAQKMPKSMFFDENSHILYTNGRNVSGGIYDEGAVKDWHLWFSQPNYWQLMVSNYQSKTDIPATMIVGTDTFFNVGVRFKGNTSYQQVQTSQKKSFNITMDYLVPDQNLGGYSTLNLNNAFEDASFMREVSYLHQIRRHIPAAKANYVRLFINGVSWGIYPNVQQINGDYIKEWFFSNDGTRWRADRPTSGPGPGGGNWGDGTAGLNFLGSDTTTYKQYYTLKKANKENPWDDLVNTCNVLNTTPLANLETEVAEVLDLDRTLWFLASEIAFSDDDSYIYKGKMDYFLYWDPETARMTPLEFDGNSVMKSNAASWGVFYNETKVNYPLLNRLLAVPSIRQRYLAHFRTLIADEMNTTEFNALVDQYDALIGAGVMADTKKLYSNTQYNTEKQTIKNFVQSHRNTLLNNAEMNVPTPTATDAALHSATGLWASPVAQESPTVTVKATSTNGISGVKLFYSPSLYGNFTTTTMYDDGQHGDGAANDGVWGAKIPGYSKGTHVRFYFEVAAANNAKTVTYLPAGAEHDVFYYQVAAQTVENAPVVINEIMASNSNTAADEKGQYEDWIELYNRTDDPVNLSGFGLSDNPSNFSKWVFPEGTVIEPRGYLIVWADEDGNQGPLHASFKLAASGETLTLSDLDGNIWDDLEFGQQLADMGYARVPNGTGPFVIQLPTFGANNSPSTSVADFDEMAVAGISVSPNPAADWATLVLKGGQADDQVRIFDAYGRQIAFLNARPSVQLNTSNWPAGIYWAQWGGISAKFMVR